MCPPPRTLETAEGPALNRGKENGGILLLFLNVGAAPSSGHLLDRAKTVNLMKMPLWNIMYSVLSTVWIFLIYQGGQHQKILCTNNNFT